MNQEHYERLRAVPAGPAARGTIVTIRPNRRDRRGFGTIAPDGGGRGIHFDNGSVEGPLRALGSALRRLWRTRTDTGREFDRLRVGQRVTFAVGADPRQPNRAYAERLRPSDEGSR